MMKPRRAGHEHVSLIIGSSREEVEKRTNPEEGDGRLGSLLDALLDLSLRLAHLSLVLLCELGVATSLLGGLRLGKFIMSA